MGLSFALLLHHLETAGLYKFIAYYEMPLGAVLAFQKWCKFGDFLLCYKTEVQCST